MAIDKERSEHSSLLVSCMLYPSHNYGGAQVQKAKTALLRFEWIQATLPPHSGCTEYVTHNFNL